MFFLRASAFPGDHVPASSKAPSISAFGRLPHHRLRFTCHCDDAYHGGIQLLSQEALSCICPRFRPRDRELGSLLLAPAPQISRSRGWPGPSAMAAQAKQSTKDGQASAPQASPCFDIHHTSILIRPIRCHLASGLFTIKVETAAAGHMISLLHLAVVLDPKRGRVRYRPKAGVTFASPYQARIG